jgi:hypothetical protein
MADNKKQRGRSFDGSDIWASTSLEATWFSTEAREDLYEVVVVRFEHGGSFVLALVVSEEGDAPQFNEEDLGPLLTGPARDVDDEQIALAAVTRLRERQRAATASSVAQPTSREPGRCACGRALIHVDVVDFHLSQLSKVITGEEPVVLAAHRRDVEAARTATIGASIALCSPQLAAFLLRAHYDEELWTLTVEETLSRVGGDATDQEILRCLRAWSRRLNEIDAALQRTGDGKTLGPTAVGALHDGRPTLWFPHVETCPMSVLSESAWNSVNARGGAS